MSDQNFAVEQLENRLENCYLYWYVGICYKRVWIFNVPYFCWKVRWVC
jgi:hypothetical protein